MKIKLLKPIAGKGFVYGAGLQDLPQDLAMECIKHGIAEFEDGSKPIKENRTLGHTQVKNSANRKSSVV